MTFLEGSQKTGTTPLAPTDNRDNSKALKGNVPSAPGPVNGDTMAGHRSMKSPAAFGAPATDHRENPSAGGASATSSARGERIRCAACRALNPPTNRFCHDCGHGLWEPCYQCRTPNAATEKFCGSCGANLSEWLEEQLARLEGDLEAVQRLEEEGHFDQALGQLRKIAALEDSRLREYAERASKRIPQCVSQFRGWQEKAAGAEKKARDRLANRDYHQALLILEAVPPAVRTPESNRLLEEARAAIRDIDQLSAEVDALSRGPLSTESLAKVGQLLALQPDHADAARLGARLSGRLLDVARSRLAAGRYQEVKKILDQVPESLRTDALQAIRDQAAEITCLARQFRTAPRVDEVLVAFAAKFRTLAPQDAETLALCAKLEKRFRDHPRDIEQMAPSWAKLPEKAAIGPPVEWATGLGRIELDPDFDPTVLLQNPGRFAVACGAALQGLGEAAIEINLLPQEDGIWQRAVRWLSKRRARSAWGIDLGSSGVKAVKLTRGDNPDDPVVLTACDVVEYDKVLSQAASETQQRSLLEAAVGMFFARNDSSADRICITLPPKSVWVRSLEMPPLAPDKFEAAMQYAGVGAFPMPFADLEWRYAVLDESATLSDPPGSLQVAMFGVNRLVLKSWLAAIEAIGLRVDIVQSDCLALHNFATYAYLQQDSEESGGTVPQNASVAILDVGADASNLVVSGPNWAWFHAGGLGVDRTTQALVRQCRIPFGKAEQWKRNPASAANIAVFWEAIQPVFADLFQETKTELEAFEQAHPDRPLQRLLALGGGMRLHGLYRYLWTRD